MLKGSATSVLLRARAVLAHVALACVVLRALLPVGYMADLQAAAHGEFKVVICSANGPKTINLDSDLGLPPVHAPGSSTAQDDLCPFGTNPAAAPLPAPLAIAVRHERVVQSVAVRTAVQAGHFIPGPPVGSRAPPVAHPIA